MGPANKSVDQKLRGYNLLVLQQQDEAFNLAYVLLGNEAQAEKILGAIFYEYYSHMPKNGRSFRSEILAAVVLGCLRQGNRLARQQDLQAYLASLTNIERAAVVLVDSMGIKPLEAAGIIRISRLKLAKLLASGRCKIAQALPKAF